MADIPTPDGYSTTSKPGEYRSEWKSPGGQTLVNVTNAKTGERWLYGKSPIPGGGDVPLSYTNANGVTSITNKDNYKVLGADAEKIENLNKQQSISLINQVSTAEDKAQIKNTNPGLKSGVKDGPPPSQDSSGADAEGSFDASQMKDINVTLADNPSTRKAYGNLQYPVGMDISNQDHIKFTMLKYEAKPLQASKIAEGTGFGTRNSNRSPMGTVILPITGPISDTNTADWSSSNISAVQAMGASASADMIQNGLGEGASAAAKDLVSLVGSQKGDLQKAISVSFAGEAVGAQNLLARTSGAILNPNMELLFNGPQLRQFSFTFRMTPRSKDEAEQVRKIIRFFKQGMSVKRGASQLFLKAPNTFKVQYINKAKDHPYIGKVKECALLSCGVNYAPDGTYMTYAEIPSMTAYEMTLSFTELEPVYDDEYGNDDNNVGY